MRSTSGNYPRRLTELQLLTQSQDELDCFFIHAGMLDRDRGLKALDRAMLFQMLAVEEDAKDIWSDCGNTI